MKKFFKYIENLWLGRDGKISLRSFGAIVLMTDFVINLHNCSYVVIRVLKLITQDKLVDAALVSSLSAYLAQIAMMLGVEAALIAALLALKTYQPYNTTSTSPSYQDTPVNQVTKPIGE